MLDYDTLSEMYLLVNSHVYVAKIPRSIKNVLYPMYIIPI